MANKNNKKYIAILLAVFIVGFCAAIGYLIVSNSNKDKAQNTMEDLKNTMVSDVSQENTDSSSSENNLGIDIPARQIDFKGLQESNPDIYAWIYVPGTSVDYPILQRDGDDLYYLEHNIDGSAGYPGCIYTEGSVNKKTFDDYNTVIYGHNMNNGTMFATLHRYADKEFFDENRYVYIYTEAKTFVYEIFAAYNYSDTHLLKGIDVSTQEAFAKYIKEIYKQKGMDSNFLDEQITDSDHIITLSTCTSNDEKRFLVQAVLKN